jgi:UPF0716 protein FxsA
MAFSLVPFLLLAIPIAEIAMFIVVGGQIGVLATLGLILVTAVLGSVLLRLQGFGILQRIAAETKAGRVPGRELVHGAMILVAGVLLLTPGFVTDTLGFLLFIPAVRDAAWKLLRDRVTIVAQSSRFGMKSGQASPHPGSRPDVIDLASDEFERRHPSDPEDQPTDSPAGGSGQSPWRKTTR